MFWLWIINSLVHSVMLFWLSFGAITQDVAWSNGRDAGYLMFGNMVYTVSCGRGLAARGRGKWCPAAHFVTS